MAGKNCMYDVMKSPKMRDMPKMDDKPSMAETMKKMAKKKKPKMEDWKK